MASCIFCKIIKGEIPSMKILETDKTFAFLDIQPLSKGHALVIPKAHGKLLTDIPDDYLADLLPVAKKVAKAVAPEGNGEFNILQNNGPRAHQVVEHVHFHVIPKPNEKEGLVIGWPATEPGKEQLAKLLEEIKSRL